MIKYLYLVLLLFVLAACKQKPTTITKVNLTKTTEQIVKVVKQGKWKYNDPLFYQYAHFLDSLNTSVPQSAVKATDMYARLFKGKSQQVCDTAFTIFNGFYKKLADSLEQVNYKDSTDLDKYYAYTDGPKESDIPIDVRSYVKNLRYNGFDIKEEEGAMYVAQDRDFVAKYFYSFVSPIMKQFLVQVNKEYKEIYMEDASIVIGEKGLVDRAIWWEEFEKKYPDFIWRSEVTAISKEYLHVLLKGSDNTDVMDEGNKLSDYFKRAYSYLEKKHPTSNTSKLVMPFYHLLLKGDKAKADELIAGYEKSGVFEN